MNVFNIYASDYKILVFFFHNVVSPSTTAIQLRKLCFWTCRSTYLERYAEHSLMHFTLFTHVKMSSKRFLLLV